ncbi:MAG: nitroimidazol reductase NimA-like FMN-containing flavoprotein [Halobacteriales archaeon]|jgi:nitroimidazol reductase NimA-like FMN-containing flavoprotein (pyridoxamine 5'-phosphate oxidase superfamily)
MRELSATEVDAVIEREGVGVLALSENDVPYSLPMSYGYDRTGERFFMMFGANGRKAEYVDANDVASLTIVEREDYVWRSVLVRGTIDHVPEELERQAFAALATTATFPTDLQVWGERLEDTTLTMYVLDIEELTGREFRI